MYNGSMNSFFQNCHQSCFGGNSCNGPKHALCLDTEIFDVTPPHYIATDS